MKVYAVVAELYMCSPDYMMFYDSLKKAKDYLKETSKEFVQEKLTWKNSKSFEVKVSSQCCDEYYIETIEVH